MSPESVWLAEVVVIVALLFISFFFSGSETALTALSRARIFKLVQEGNKRAKQVEALRDRKDEMISTILLANNLVNTIAAALTTAVTIELFGQDDSIALAIGTFIIALIIIIFSEILPKTIALRHAETVALYVAGPIDIAIRLLSPFTRAVQWVIRGLLRVLGLHQEGAEQVDAADVIRGTIELHHREGEVVKHERDMLGSILDLGDLDVSDVMIHRKHIEMIDFSQPVEDIIRRVVRSTHSRLPFWKDNPDNVVGVLHVKDLLRVIGERGRAAVTHDMIERLLTKPWFIPENTTLREQLIAFRLRRRHFAVVVDEYGVLMGILTLEDIIEEIVGEIDDEHDRVVGQEVISLGGGTYRVTGTTSLRDLNRHLDWNLPDEDASTVGGLIIHAARAIPEQGAEFSFFGYRFYIEEKRANQILSLRICKQPEEAEA
jgi:Mg2+/Co2+ transporter CorB